MAGGARGWVSGRAGFWGALATWVWGQQLQSQVPGHPTSICDAGVNAGLNFKKIKKTCMEIVAGEQDLALHHHFP